MGKLKELKNNWRAKDIIICLLFSIYVLITTFSTTAWYTFSEGTAFCRALKLIRYAFYVIFALYVIVKLLRKEYSKEALFYFILLFIFSFIGIFTGKDKSLFLAIIYFACFFGYSSKRLIKYSTIVQGGLLFITIICAFLGLADNSILDFTRMRYSLGFDWSSFASILYLFVALEYIYVRRSGLTFVECIVIEAVNVFIYKYTNTKMSFLILTAVMIVMFIGSLSDSFVQFGKRLLDKTEKFIIIVPVMGAFLACWLPLYNADSKIWYTLNSMLSGRLWQCKNAIIKYGFSLFGKHMEAQTFSVTSIGNEELTYFIDSGYLHFAMKYGIIVLILLVALYVISIWKAYRNKDYYMIFIFVVLSVFCINDLYLINAYNIFTIYIFCDNDIFKEIPLLQKLSKPVGVVYDCIGNISSKMSKKER